MLLLLVYIYSLCVIFVMMKDGDYNYSTYCIYLSKSMSEGQIFEHFQGASPDP